MPSVAYFRTEGDTIVVQQRAEGDGLVGDSLDAINPGDKIVVPGLSYEALLAAGGGTIEFAEDGSATIVPAKEVA